MMKERWPRGKEARAMDRAHLRRLARDRILDAKGLLAAGRWGGAYYLAGYAVECGLKACIITRLLQSDQFPERRFSEQCWSHNLVQLLGLAGLEAALAADAAANPDLLANWGTVKDWNESSRYERKTRAEARRLYEAIADKKHGVLSWIKRRW
jgi:hypothetical protein